MGYNLALSRSADIQCRGMVICSLYALPALQLITLYANINTHFSGVMPIVFMSVDVQVEEDNLVG